MFGDFFHRVVNWILRRNAAYNLKQRRAKLGRVGKNVSISQEAVFRGKIGNIRIGENVQIIGPVVFDCDTDKAQIEIGDNALLIGPCQIMTYGGTIKMGNHCSVNPFGVIYGHGGLKIGDYVRIAAHTVIIPANHIFADPSVPITFQGLSKEGIKIGNDVWVGAGVRILDGSVIGNGCVIGSNTVVNGQFEPFSVIVGTPGKKIKTRGN